MIQFGEQSGRLAFEQPSPAFAQRQKPSRRSWLILVSGSVLLHLLLMRWVGSAIQPGLKSAAAMPIDLVDLPASSDSGLAPVNPPAEGNAKPAGAAQSHAVSSAAAVSSQTVDSAEERSETQPASAPILRQSAPAIAKLMPAVRHSRQFAKAIPSSLPPSARSPESAPPASPLASATPAAPAVQPAPAAQAPATALPAPATLPLISSQAIALPVPDLSQPSPSQPANAISAPEQSLIPNYLTANLAASAPGDSQLTKPHIEVQRFLTNSQLPPCAVTPEAIYFLGKTVALRVTTNATGQVVQTVTEQSSRNLAYDDLATCLVRNWDFKPVVAHSQSVAPEGLVVHITIDRS